MHQINLFGSSYSNLFIKLITKLTRGVKVKSISSVKSEAKRLDGKPPRKYVTLTLTT